MSRKFFKNKEQLEVLANKVSSGRLDRGARKKKAMLAMMVILAIIIGLIYAFVYSPILKMRKVVIDGINGVDALNQIQIAANKYTSGYKFLFVPRDNLLFLDKEGLIKFLEDSAPVEKVKVEKKMFKILAISGKEKLPALLWQEGEQNYYVDKTGLVMAAVAADNIKHDLPIISGSTTTAVTVGRKIINDYVVTFIQAVLQKISNELKGWRIKRVEVQEHNNREINFYTNEGWYLIFDVEGDTEKALKNLVAFLKQTERNTKGLQYVDLRIPDKIFYK